MILLKPKCPECKSPAIGTVDLIPGTALFAEPAKRGSEDEEDSDDEE